MVPLLQLLNVILKMNDALHLHRQVNISMNSAIHKSSYNNFSSIMLNWLKPMPLRLTENMTGMEWLDQNMTVTWSIDPRILSSEIIRAAIFSACQESKLHYEGYVSHPCHKNPSCILKPKLNFSIAQHIA